MCAAATALQPIARFCSQLSTILQYMPTLTVYGRLDSSIDANRLFRDTEARFPQRWRKDGWYLSTVSTIFPGETLKLTLCVFDRQRHLSLAASRV